MALLHNLSTLLPQCSATFLTRIEQLSVVKNVPAQTEILRDGQYVKAVPILLSGLIKVLTRQEDKELLLYYIEPGESCVMSFAAGLRNEPSRVYAIAETDATLMLLPTTQLGVLSKEFPELNLLFFQQYNMRYSELLSSIRQLLFDKMDKRVYEYLLEKSRLNNTSILKISHKQIALALGTAREVVSRVIKKLELEGKLRQQQEGIKIF